MCCIAKPGSLLLCAAVSQIISRSKQPAARVEGAPETSSLMTTSSRVMSASTYSAELEAALVPTTAPAESARRGRRGAALQQQLVPATSSSSHSTAATHAPSQPAQKDLATLPLHATVPNAIAPNKSAQNDIATNKHLCT